VVGFDGLSNSTYRKSNINKSLRKKGGDFLKLVTFSQQRSGWF